MSDGRIFISYRRQDAAGHAGRLRDRLVQAFGDRVFHDVDTIPLGADFLEVIQKEIDRCVSFLAVIGPQWSEARNETGRRLDEPDDPVRLEVRLGLRSSVPVVPVLVGGATMPATDELPTDLKELAFRNGMELRHSAFDRDMKALLTQLEGWMGRQFLEPARSGERRAADRISGNRDRVPRLLIYWHRYGLTKEDASRIQDELAPKGIVATLDQHRNENAPDAFFVKYDMDVDRVRAVLRTLPELPTYIFPYDYPNDESGYNSDFDMSVGLHAIHRYRDEDPTEIPYLLQRLELDYLIDDDVDQVEFVHRLHQLAPSRQLT